MIENGGTVRKFRLVPAVVFVYDCSRLLFLIVLLTDFIKPVLDLSTVKVPLMMYASPNALFPLMSFFLLLRFEASKAYIPLYITGKFLSLICIMIWVIYSYRQVDNVLDVLWAVFFSAADLGSIMGMTTLLGENVTEGGT